jgi:hypothetical protein
MIKSLKFRELAQRQRRYAPLKTVCKYKRHLKGMNLKEAAGL